MRTAGRVIQFIPPEGREKIISNLLIILISLFCQNYPKKEPVTHHTVTSTGINRLATVPMFQGR